MTRTRREPRPERDDALARFAGAVAWAAVAVAILRYGSRLGESDADVAKIAAVPGGMALLYLGGATWSLARWLTALRHQRMLRDPLRAAQVPPRAEHLSRLRESTVSGFAVLAGLVGGVVLIAAGLKAGPAEDPGVLGYYGVAALVFGVVEGRKWLRARKVKRMSTRPMPGGGAAPEPSPRRAARIPSLEVTFQAPTSHPSSGLQVTTERNVFGRRPWKLAYLRLFDNHARLEEFLGSAWRECGYVHFIHSAASVDRAELEAAKRGRRLVIGSRDRLLAELRVQPVEPVSLRIQQSRQQRRLASQTYMAQVAKRRPRPTRAEWLQLARQHQAEARRPRFRVAYPVRSLLCHQRFWKSALDVLLERVDVVVLDLSGYQRKNLGTGYELQRVVDRFPIRRCILLADPQSDAEFLEAQIRGAWSRMADGAPNAGEHPRSVLVAQTGQRAGSVPPPMLPGWPWRSGPVVPTGERSRRETLALAAILQRRLDDPDAT